MLQDNVRFINEAFTLPLVTPGELDELLAEGWRHFGTYFFRYNLAVHAHQLTKVVPLRVNLGQFLPSPSQQKVLRKNADLQTIIRPAVIDAAKLTLFDQHKERFETNVPDSIYTFLSMQPDRIPCQAVAVEIYNGDALLACSFLDLGHAAVSSVYAMFDPDHGKRSLGIYTMLLEIDWAIAQGKTYYYQGYCYDMPSHYDYKKKFGGLEMFDFTNETWQAVSG